jgi:uncharacterized protein involved in exopolysaccharide biosynthesis
MTRRSSVAYRMIDAFFRHKWLFVTAVLLVSSTTVMLMYLRSRTFHANALTQVVTEDIASELGEKPDNRWTTPAQQNVDHLQDLLNDDLPHGFVDTALQNANLSKPINLDPAAHDARYEKLKKQLSCATQSQTTYSIGLVWDKADECQRIVEAFRQQYIAEVGLERQANSIATSKFLDSQIADYATRMRKAEQVLIKYRTTNPQQLPEAQSAAIAQLGSLQAQLDNLRIGQHDSEMKRQALLARIAQIKPMSVREQSMAESPLMTRIKDLKAKRETLLAGNMLPEHPDVVAITQQIDNLQRQFDTAAKSGNSEAAGAVSTTLQENPEYQNLQQQLMEANISQQTQQAQMNLLSQTITQYEMKVQAMPTAQRELTDKTRDYTVLKAQYETLLARREQAQLKGNLEKVSASSMLLPIGAVYAEPTTGKNKFLMMIGGAVFLGILVGIIAIVMSEWTDRSLRYSSDTEKILGVPVLGIIPDDPRMVPGVLEGQKQPRELPSPPVFAESGSQS